VLVGTSVGVGVGVLVDIATSNGVRVGMGACRDEAQADKMIAINRKKKRCMYKALTMGLLMRLSLLGKMQGG
jgi:hypothetical protein